MADVSVADSGTSTTSSPIKPVEKSVVIDDSPKPVQIIIRDSQDKHKFHLNDEQLKKILTKDPDTKNLQTFEELKNTKCRARASTCGPGDQFGNFEFLTENVPN